MFHNSLWMARSTKKKTGGKKRKRKNPLSKDARGGRGEGREGYVTFDRTRKHNKSSEGCPWKRGGTRILFFIRPDAFSVSLPRASGTVYGTKARVYAHSARRAKASLSLRRVPRFEIKHLASRPPAPPSFHRPSARPFMPVCVRVHACTYIHGCTRLARFQTHCRAPTAPPGPEPIALPRMKKKITFSLYRIRDRSRRRACSMNLKTSPDCQIDKIKSELISWSGVSTSGSNRGTFTCLLYVHTQEKKNILVLRIALKKKAITYRFMTILSYYYVFDIIKF